jgi:hypothetical protein
MGKTMKQASFSHVRLTSVGLQRFVSGWGSGVFGDCAVCASKEGSSEQGRGV